MWESNFDRRVDEPQTQEQQRQAAIEKIVKETWAEIKTLKGQIKIVDAKINKMISTWEKNVAYREGQFKKPWNQKNDRKNLEAWIKNMENVVWWAKRIASAIKLINNNPNDSNAVKINNFVDKYSLELKDAKKLLASMPQRSEARTSWINVNEVDQNWDVIDNTDYSIPLNAFDSNNAITYKGISYKQIMEKARNDKDMIVFYKTLENQLWSRIAAKFIPTAYWESMFDRTIVNINYNTWDYSVGLGQVNLLAHNSAVAKYTWSYSKRVNAQWLKNPENNAIMCAQIYKSQWMQAWSAARKMWVA